MTARWEHIGVNGKRWVLLVAVGQTRSIRLAGTSRFEGGDGKMGKVQLMQGDCIELMRMIPDNSVDCVLTDPPYGTTACKWDSIIPFEPMWEQLNRIIKPSGAICLFGGEPFSSMLRLSNLKGFKYDWIWKKSKSGSAFTAKYRPVNKHEIISVFSKCGGKTAYFPQMSKGEPYIRTHRISEVYTNNHHTGFNKREVVSVNEGYRYPITILEFPQKWRRQDQVHPTQKPVELLEYLIKTYTAENETVLDFTMGSGSTGVACIHTNRNFIGIELDERYFEIARNRLGKSCTEASISFRLNGGGANG